MNYEIDITRRCNFKCPGCNHLCNIISDASSDFTADEMKLVVDQINELDPAPNQMIFVGGEPTLHPLFLEFCRYVKDKVKSYTSLRIMTNYSNPDISAEAERMGYHLGDYLGPRDAEKLRVIKANVHFNVLLSPKEEHMASDSPSTCFVLRGLGGSGPCGLNVHKYRGRLQWCYCPCASSLCKLLQREEEFMFPTLKALLASDMDKLRREVCVHCMSLAKQKVMAKDTPNQVSSCFREGLEAFRRYGAEAEAAASGGVR